MMPLDMQRHFVALLCLRCQQPTEKMSPQQIAFRLRVDETFLKRIHETFLKQGFINEDWSICNWNKRQFISDSSTDRVRAHRERQALKQDETLHVTNETVTVTAPEQNRTEQNHKKQQPLYSNGHQESRFHPGYIPPSEKQKTKCFECNDHKIIRTSDYKILPCPACGGKS